MAEIQTAVNDNRRAGVARMRKQKIRTDMTPMVDLGFLLITFFVVSTELDRPRTTHLAMPKESIHKTLVGETDALTILLDAGKRVFAYEGQWAEAVEKNMIHPTSLSYRNGIGDWIRQKQTILDKHPKAKEGRDGLILIIKPGNESDYQSLIDILDEVLINDVKKYVIVPPSKKEIEWLAAH